MKLATTTGDFDRFCPTYEERVTHLVSAGFRHILTTYGCFEP